MGIMGHEMSKSLNPPTRLYSVNQKAYHSCTYWFHAHLEFIRLSEFFFGCDRQSMLIGDLSKLDVSKSDFDEDCLVSNLQYVWAISLTVRLIRYTVCILYTKIK